jgi:hypothetical protein
MTLLNHRRVIQRDSKGKEKEVLYYKPVEEIAQALRKKTGAWPRKVTGTLFIAKKPEDCEFPDENAISYLKNAGQLEAWLQSIGGISFRKGMLPSAQDGEIGLPKNAVTVSALFDYLEQNPFETYDSVEQLPHEPPRKKSYYLERDIEPEDNGKIDEFLSRFNPQTAIDRESLKAMLLTLFAGLPEGQRPAFVISSEYGRGTGKTATADAILSVAGGAINIGQKEQSQRITEALLSDGALERRGVLIDNIRGKVKDSLVESGITASRIEGHRLYIGRASRPNTLTWVLTANSPTLSNDLAQRSIIIQIGRPQRGVDFVGWVRAWLEENRKDLIADILYTLQNAERKTIPPEHRGRFSAWENSVLSCLKNPEKVAARLYKLRRIADEDAENAERLHEAFTEFLEGRDLDTKESRYFINWTTVARICTKAWNEQGLSARRAGAMVREVLGNEHLPFIRECKDRRVGRGVLWVGDEVDMSSPPEIIQVKE